MRGEKTKNKVSNPTLIPHTCTHTTGNQWLQFDIGPPTLVTGLVSKGRPDSRKKQWVTKYRISYSNDSQVWYYYKDAPHLEAKVTVG